MRNWLESLPPRLHGLLLVGCALMLVGVDFGVARMLGDQFYPALLPAVGFITPMGLFMIVSGYGAKDMREQRVPRAMMIPIVLAMVAGAVLGLEANKAFFGVRW